MEIAVITGATSGLGNEFLLQIDRKYTLDEIWVIGRRRERLKLLKPLCKTPLRLLCFDLTEKEAIGEIADLLAQEQPVVQFLVNAAGMGKIGAAASLPLTDCEEMIDLNCRAAVSMTQICLPFMGKGSRILQIASTAAFSPFQYLGIYAASKAFLYRYSRALHTELLFTGIHVTAVCPYWIKDTEFIDLAQQTDTQQKIRHFPLASKKRHVVSWALRDSALNLPVSTPGPVCTIHRIAAWIIPDELMMGIWALLRRL